MILRNILLLCVFNIGFVAFLSMSKDCAVDIEDGKISRRKMLAFRCLAWGFFLFSVIVVICMFLEFVYPVIVNMISRT